MTDPYAIAGYAFLLTLVLWLSGLTGWLWRKFVVRRIVSIWRKTPTDRPAIPNKLRFDVFERDDFRCVYCGRDVKDGVGLFAKRLDHYVPWHVTKKHPGPEGFVTACHQCNDGKRGRIMKLPISKFVQ